MSNPEDYTVGWICAISTEYVAAQAFLDAKHDGPAYVSPRDNNDYTLGKIGKHNVVIAVLPEGEYGISPATSVARDMLHSFPNVRIGLMVGIAGGAPSRKHDIRLGDIVVSTPWDGKGGVLQYDFGRTIQDQSFRPTGFLDQAPMVLRTAINGLKAQYETDGHQLEVTIDDILEKKKPRLRKKYRRPDPSSDKLYISKVTHPPNDESSCAVVCSNDESSLILRVARGEDEDDPTIHFGLIASANQLMQDAVLRDKFAKENDVLCFEMEAAGLMNHFPCLVIRGICDYSDTHKNKEWQGYAAMAAAAYTKDLLRRIPPNRIEAERRINDVLSSDIREIQRDVKRVAFTQRQKEVMRWLSSPDPSTNYNKALKQRQADTGLWFLHGDSFATWKTKRNSCMWLYGMPGCGKTILSSTIVEDLMNTPIKPLLYFYFDFNDTGKQSLESLVRSLISQLYNMYEANRKPLDSLFDTCDQGHRQPSSQALCQAFSDMMDQVKEAWIVLDALDECCQDHPREDLLLWMSDLVKSERRNIHLLLTSRPEQDIQSKMSDLVHEDQKIHLQSDLISSDINAYIHSKVREGDALRRWQGQQDVQDEIEAVLIHKANGMFRWAACQIDALEKCLDYRSLESTLTLLPETLDETYSRILHDIPPAYKRYATTILQLITFSARPLTIKEAVDAITVDTDGPPYFCPKYRMPNPQEITRYCSSLVAVVSIAEDSDSETNSRVELQLAHFSVKEYLMSNRIDRDIAPNFQESIARAANAKVCLAYLLQFEQDVPLDDIGQCFPFAHYSARYWMRNAAGAMDTDTRVLELIEQLLCYQGSSYKVSYSLYKPDQPWNNRPSQRGEEPASALYYAACEGLLHTVGTLLKRGFDPNAHGGEFGNALQVACLRRHEQVVKLLLDKGADPNKQGGSCGNAFQAACFGGHEQVVKLLLDKGADPNMQGGFFGNAFQAASSGGHEPILRLLLDLGVDVNAQGVGSYSNALQAASARGHKQVVKLLLDLGTNSNTLDRRFSDALQQACFGGHEETVRLLVDSGADVNAQGGGPYDNAFHAACVGGHELIVKLLVDSGVDVNAQGGGIHGNAFQAACFVGHESIVRLLVDLGADVNAQGRGIYGNAFQSACFRGHESIVRLLVDLGADVNAQGRGIYGNAFQSACFRGHESIVRLLVDLGADVNAQGRGIYGNAFQSACFRGHESIVRLLLDLGADVNTHGGGTHGNAFQAACYGGHEAIVRLLLDLGADVNAQCKEEPGNALHAACHGGHESIVRLLVDLGADINAQSGYCNYALQAASAGGHEAIVKLLVDLGADVNAQSEEGLGNALQAACYGGHESIVRLLVDLGADINVQSGDYGYALQAASSEGHELIVRLLVNLGADVNAKGGNFGNAVQAACFRGHEQIVRLLIDFDADIYAQSRRYDTALKAASLGGHELIIKLLVDLGADVNTQGGHFGNILQAASAGGHELIVKLLVDLGAHVNTQGGHFGNALQAASAGGYKLIVKLLVDLGAHVNTQGGHFGNALQAASAGGHELIVKLLVDLGAHVNTQGGHFGNALQAASAGGHELIVKLLVDLGADVNTQGGQFGNALQAACFRGYEPIIKLLVDLGADVNTQGGHFSNALQAASAGGHELIVKLLINLGANVNTQGGHFGNTLQAACFRGYEPIIKLLVDLGADVNTQGGHFGNALQAASAGGHELIVKLLVDLGANINNQGGYYGSALQAALAGGHKQVARLLFDKGGKLVANNAV